MNKLRLDLPRVKRWVPLLALAVLALAYAAMREAPTVMTAVATRELPVYIVDTEEKVLSISFDAAWGCANTEGILDILDRYDVKTTFFLVGFWAEKYPELVAELVARGHEIGNHTATHPHMNSISVEQMRKETVEYDDKIEELTGKRCKVFRAPFGEYNDKVITTMRSFGYEVIQWDIDTIDWKQERSAQTILDTVLPKLHPGCIILCHNNGYKIKEYLPTLIKTAQEQGYEFVTVSELLLEGDTIIDVNGVQKKK